MTGLRLLRTTKIEEEVKVKYAKKRRFYGNGEWFCLACGAIYTSTEARGLGLMVECGCPNCGGLFSYEEI